MKLKFKKKYIKDKSYDLARYSSERKTITSYGLRNKKEIGKYTFLLKKYRNLFKLNQDNLINKTLYDSAIQKITKQGILTSEKTVLDLDISDFLERRLQTQVYKQGLAKTLMHARQLIVHKHIKINNEISIRPSRIINISDVLTSTYKI